MKINIKKAIGILLICTFAVMLVIMLVGMNTSIWIPDGGSFRHVAMPHPDDNGILTGFSYAGFLSIFLIIEAILAVLIAWLFTCNCNKNNKKQD